MKTLTRAYAAKAPCQWRGKSWITWEKTPAIPPFHLKVSWANGGLFCQFWSGILTVSFTFLDQTKQELEKAKQKYVAKIKFVLKPHVKMCCWKKGYFISLAPNRGSFYWRHGSGQNAYATVVGSIKTNPIFTFGPMALPAPPSGKQYQLWALKDGNPIDMGVFDVSNSELIESWYSGCSGLCHHPSKNRRFSQTNTWTNVCYGSWSNWIKSELSAKSREALLPACWDPAECNQYHTFI